MGSPPPLVEATVLPPAPQVGRPRAEVYSVSVHNAPVRDLLFAMARDARLNLDVHPDLTGKVSVNAIDQTIQEILDRIALQVDMRYELEGRNLFVMPDAPVLRHYTVDYPNLAREANSEMSANSTIGRGGGQGNASSSSLANTSQNRFWPTLTQNIRDLLRETDKLLPGATDAAPAAPPRSGGANPAAPAAAPTPAAAGAASGDGQNVRFREAASVIANPETGVISVRASYRQHLRVREFLDRVLNGARRQVLIEATIVEVNLSDEHQQGVNWTFLRETLSLDSNNETVREWLPLATLGPVGSQMPSGVPAGGVIPSMANFSRLFRNQARPGERRATEVAVAVRLLESFGNTKILSSPKISALNNQAALLKVTEDIVYFTMSANYQPGIASTGLTPAIPPVLTVTTTPNTVSVGLVMSVMAQISDDDEVTLILRPTLSRVRAYVEDPGVAIVLSTARANGSDVPAVPSRVPQIETREMESVIKVRSGDTAVLGGLMRENAISNTDQTPGLGNLPGVGNLFKYKSNGSNKSELVIFLKPTVVTSASLGGDYRPFRPSLDGALRPLPEHPDRPPTGSLPLGSAP